MRILLAGSSGFLGAALRQHLTDHGFTTRQLVRRQPVTTDEVMWDPYGDESDDRVLQTVGESNVVVNFTGVPVAHFPWTKKYRRLIRDSRVLPTRKLADAVAAATPAPLTFVNASAIGVYGQGRGDEVLTEDSEPGNGFLADMTREWEAATARAHDAGARVLQLRLGVVLGAEGGALGTLAGPVRLGVGGVGGGPWWMSTVSRLDFCRAVVHLLFSELAGPVNVTGPEPATNAEFAAALGHRLHRRVLLPLPSAVVGRLGRTMAQEILSSQRVVPRRLLDDGFVFADPSVEGQLKSAFS